MVRWEKWRQTVRSLFQFLVVRIQFFLLLYYSLFIRCCFRFCSVVYCTLDYILVQFDKLKDFWLYKLRARRQKQTKKEPQSFIFVGGDGGGVCVWCVTGGESNTVSVAIKSYFSSSGAINCHHISLVDALKVVFFSFSRFDSTLFLAEHRKVRK